MGKERKESVGIANFVSSFIQRWWAQGDFLTTNLFFNRDTFKWKSWFRFTAMFNSGILTGVRVLHLLWTWYWSVLKCCWHINIPLFLYTFLESVIINSVSAYNCNKVVSPVSFKLWITRGYFNYTYTYIWTCVKHGNPELRSFSQKYRINDNSLQSFAEQQKYIILKHVCLP